MIRNILAAVGGYIALVIAVLAGIGIAWAVLGGEGAFAGQGPEPATLWMTINVLSGFLAALVGGWVARKIGTSAASVTILVGMILVLGVVSAVVGAGGEREVLGKPVSELTFTEAVRYAVQPAWYNWVIPIVGAVGAWVGGRRKEDGEPGRTP